MNGSLNLCQVSTGQEQDWQTLYDTSFPADERTPKDELLKLLESGAILLHRTTNELGELLCFSIVYPMSNFALLSYIATDQTKRSSGVGSKHMKELLEILKKAYPDSLGLVLEIESTRQSNLESTEKTNRQRRLNFYVRLGAKRLCRTYVWPSYATKGTYRLAELMWFDFDPATIDDPHLPGIVTELYTKGYGAQADDPILELVVHQFKCSDKTGTASMVCPVDPPEGEKSEGQTKEASVDSAVPEAPPVASPVPAVEEVKVPVVAAPEAAVVVTDSAPEVDKSAQEAPVATDAPLASVATVANSAPKLKKKKRGSKKDKGV